MVRILFVIPHYNNSKKLFRCIESIISIQTSDQLEHSIFVIDDASSMHEAEAVKKIINTEFQNENIKTIFLNINQGVSNARNLGISHAKSKGFTHISFIDCDDHLVAPIKIGAIENSSLTIFQSVETHDDYLKFFAYENSIIKINRNIYTNFSELIKEYSLRPNRVPTLTTCWAKVYRVDIIIKNSISFNTRMHTFEDVDFLLQFIFHAESIEFSGDLIYAHTNSNRLNSSTFGCNREMNFMFSFLKASRSLRKLFIKYSSPDIFNERHFLACYYSITFVRISVQKYSLSEKIELFKYIQRRIRSPFVQRCFASYNPRVANGRQILKVLIRLNSPFLLTIYLLYIAKKRYG